jgi:hypothetical protein
MESRTVTLCVDDNGMKICEPIEVTPIPGKGYRLEQRSALRRWFWLTSPSVLDSPLCAAFLDRVLASEGGWEPAFGGVLVIHLPPEAVLDVEAQFELVCRGVSDPAV